MNLIQWLFRPVLLPTIAVLIAILCYSPQSVPQATPTRSEAISFIQNAILKKGGGLCSSNSTTTSPTYTEYGPVGGGTATSSSSIFYWQTSDPAVNAQGMLHIVYVRISNSFNPGVIKSSSTTNVAMYEEDIDLSQVAPSSIDVVTGTCGGGVTFSGTTGGTIGRVRMHGRRVKASISDEDLRALMSLKCSARELEKKECSESQGELSEATIHFPRDEDMATRFAKALRDVVVLSGGRSEPY